MTEVMAAQPEARAVFPSLVLHLEVFWTELYDQLLYHEDQRGLYPTVLSAHVPLYAYCVSLYFILPYFY